MDDTWSISPIGRTDCPNCQRGLGWLYRVGIYFAGLTTWILDAVVRAMQRGCGTRKAIYGETSGPSGKGAGVIGRAVR